MISELVAAAHGREEGFEEHLYEIGATYLRAPLLHHELHTPFHALLEGIVGAYRAAGASPIETVLFDYGLACHFTSRSGDAIAAYRACLTQNPKHSAAYSNLLALLPPPTRTETIIEHAIQGFGTGAPPASITELTLRQAVYLLA